MILEFHAQLSTTEMNNLFLTINFCVIVVNWKFIAEKTTISEG